MRSQGSRANRGTDASWEQWGTGDLGRKVVQEEVGGQRRYTGIISIHQTHIHWEPVNGSSLGNLVFVDEIS